MRYVGFKNRKMYKTFAKIVLRQIYFSIFRRQKKNETQLKEEEIKHFSILLIHTLAKMNSKFINEQKGIK